MRKEIAGGPDDIERLLIEEDPYVNKIIETINDFLVSAHESEANLSISCIREKYSRITRVQVWIKCCQHSFWDENTYSEAILNRFFKKAISDFQKKWGEKLERIEINKVETIYRFVMF